MAVAAEQLEQMVGTENTVLPSSLAAVLTVSMAFPPPMAKATSASAKAGCATSLFTFVRVESVP